MHVGMRGSLCGGHDYYNFDSVPIALRRICRADTSAGAGAAALKNSWRPTTSDMVKTRDETVAPSRRFLLNKYCQYRPKLKGL